MRLDRANLHYFLLICSLYIYIEVGREERDAGMGGRGDTGKGSGGESERGSREGSMVNCLRCNL